MVARPSGTVHSQFRLLFGAGTATGLDDGQLLERFVNGRDEAAFAALMTRYGPLVLGACRRLLTDPADVEDVFQASFLVLFRKASSLKDRRLVGPWLYKVAYRVALRARADARRQSLAASEALEPASPLDLEGLELRAALDEEILRLPCRYRWPVVLCYLEGLSHEQAARQLGCPLGTVNSRLATARQKLRARLTRRGLAPPGMLAGAAFPSMVASPLVPSSLMEATCSTAQRVANGCPVAEASSAAIAALTEGMFRAMITSRIKMAAVGVLAVSLVTVSAGRLASGVPAALPKASAIEPQPKAEPQPAGEPEPRTSGEARGVRVTGTVLMPDGSPAAGATVESLTSPEIRPIIARADAAGRFQLEDLFGNCGRLHASSADGRYQTTLMIPSAAVRTDFAPELKLTLAPARSHEVIVLSDGRPVEGARVAATGQQFNVRGVTGPDGKVTLQLPATDELTGLVAWHPKLGINGRRRLEGLPLQDATRWTLLPPAPHTIRVIDPDGKPVGGLELSVAVRLEDSSEWIVTQGLEESNVRTDAQGTATVAWAPREKLRFADVRIIGSDWKTDQKDDGQTRDGTTTLHARRERTVQGHLVMPDGASAEGILITGYGFGPGSSGDIPYARARRDGTFTLRVPSEHAFVLGIDDVQWATDPWSGMILGKDNDTAPAKITMNVYPATPVTARVTRGPRHEPVVNAWVEVSRRGHVSWVDAGGKTRSATAGVRAWLRTDARGVARTGVGRGDHELRLSSGLWGETRKFKVVAGTPVEVEFYRPWLSNRRVTGRLMLEGARYVPSPEVSARAWTPQSISLPLNFKPEVHPDGTLEVAFDAEALSLLVLDPPRKRAGFVQIGKEDSPVEVNLVANASYSGELRDEKDQPLANRTIELDVKTADFPVSAPQRTDSAGRFRFEDVPSRVPLELRVRDEGQEPEYYASDRDRLFDPGEIRENDRVELHRIPSAPIARAAVPLAQRVENVCRDVRPTGMHALLILQGDASANVANVTGRLLDDDRVAAVLKYLTVRVEPGQLASEKATLAREGWPMPGPGEVALVALNGDRATLGSRRIATDQVDEAAKAGEAFLKQHLPPARNALSALTAARNEAEKTGRRVWVVRGGPRCAPCFRMGRWLDEHHAVLEKDYVIVKVMEGVDEQVAPVVAQLPWTSPSIPWFAITEPDGTILTTSEGELGNIGFPGSVEGIRHLRRMLARTARRLTPEDVDGLIRSLSPRE